MSTTIVVCTVDNTPVARAIAADGDLYSRNQIDSLTGKILIREDTVRGQWCNEPTVLEVITDALENDTEDAYHFLTQEILDDLEELALTYDSAAVDDLMEVMSDVRVLLESGELVCVYWH